LGTIMEWRLFLRQNFNRHSGQGDGCRGLP
jgi:hypothetical protein